MHNFHLWNFSSPTQNWCKAPFFLHTCFKYCVFCALIKKLFPFCRNLWLITSRLWERSTMFRFTLSSAVSVLLAFICYIVNSSQSSMRKVSDNKMILLFSLCNKFHFVNVKYFVIYIALRFERQLRKYLLAYPILLRIYF